MNNEDFLKPTLSNFKKILTPCIAIELAIRTGSEDKAIVKDFILECLSRLKVYTLFTKKGLVDISANVFGRSSVRDFMLSLSQIYMIEISGNFEGNAKDILIKILTQNIDEKIALSSSSVAMLEESKLVNDFLYSGANPASLILKAHDWLIVILLMHLSFQEVSEAVRFPDTQS